MTSRRLFVGATVWADAACVPRRAWLLLEGDRVASVGGLQEPPPQADDPLGNLRAAVDRQIGGGQALQPDQALTEQEAVRAATVAAARSLGLPAGGLAAGQLADLVVCTGDPFAPDTRIAQTWTAGERVWPPLAGEERP